MIGKYESNWRWNAYDGTGLNDNADIDKIQHYVAMHVDQKYLVVIKNVLCIVRWVGQLSCQSRGKHLHMNFRGKDIVFMQSRRPMATLIPLVFLPVRTRVVAVIIMNRVPVMIGKYESDRRWKAYDGTGFNNNAAAMSTVEIMYNAPRSKDGGQKQYPYKRSDQGSSPRKG